LSEAHEEPLPRTAVAAVMPSHGDVPTRALVEGVLEHVDTLVLVDDGSDREVGQRLDAVAARDGVELVRLAERRGKGSAICAGVARLLARPSPRGPCC
jgi:hypothetical protein